MCTQRLGRKGQGPRGGQAYDHTLRIKGGLQVTEIHTGLIGIGIYIIIVGVWLFLTHDTK